MLSFWEQQSFQSYDVIIVGAGITGLSTAAALKEQDAGINVLVLERGILPTGASTKNAGFACFGSVSELAFDRNEMGEEATLGLVEKRWNGLKKTINRLGESAIDFQRKGGYELVPVGSQTFTQMDAVNDMLRPLFGETVFQESSGQLDEMKFEGFNGLVYNPFEGQLDTGKLMNSLWEYCTQLGIKILTGINVTGYEKEEGKISVKTTELNFHCKGLALCTNAFTNEILPTDLTPGRGTVMVVKPENSLTFEGTFHFDEGFFYFRDFYGKLIFGGGRNIAFEDEKTTVFDINPKITERLHQELRERILPGQSYEVETQWSGIMAFGKSRQPIVKEIEEGVFLGVRMGGMGVAIGSMVGAELSSLILKSI